jgi:hypothetical protein
MTPPGLSHFSMDLAPGLTNGQGYDSRTVAF